MMSGLAQYFRTVDRADIAPAERACPAGRRSIGTKNDRA
jgi:hypothetical protein